MKMRERMKSEGAKKLARLKMHGHKHDSHKEEHGDRKKYAAGGEIDGGPIGGGMSKPNLSKPGRGKMGKKGGTNVNVVVMPHPPGAGGVPMPGGPPMGGAPMPPPMPRPAPPPMPSGPPMGGMPPPMMGRKHGGKVEHKKHRAMGGRTENDESWKHADKKGGQHDEAWKDADKKGGEDDEAWEDEKSGRAKRAGGGRIHMTAGADSGVGRLEKMHHMKGKK